MIWLNKVLSTPLIGLQIEPNFEVLSNYRKIIVPLLKEMHSHSEQVQFKDISSGWGGEFYSNKGYKYSFALENIIVEFSYSTTLLNNPGKFPTLAEKDLKPYLELLDECSKRIISLTSLVFGKKHTIHLKRIGIVSRANLDPDDLPPGVKSLYEYISSPWDEGLIKCQTILLAKLNTTDEYIDRCHHHINIDQTVTSPQMNFILDWQRVFTQSVHLSNKEALKKLLKQSLETAKKYFETVGQGVL